MLWNSLEVPHPQHVFMDKRKYIIWKPFAILWDFSLFSSDRHLVIRDVIFKDVLCKAGVLKFG